jgi:non-specific serine/threonine protein kinase
VVLDEAHYIKNKDAQIFKAINELNTKNKLSLSGTPMENSLSDLWAQMEFINPKILGEYSSFKKIFQDPIEKYKDVDSMEELKKILSPFILRRTKKEVLKELPDVEEQILFSEMSDDQKKLVETEKSKARNLMLSPEYDQKMKFHVFAAILRLRQLANHPKLMDANSNIMSGKYEDVTNTIDTLTLGENKVLMFSSFVSHLKLYEQYLASNNINYTKLTGEENTKQKKQAEEKFQNDDSCKVMLITVKAGGVGLNLTSANYVLILDPWWNPFPEEQAIARAHRIGQQRKVTVIRFISKDSIEEKILRLQERKIEIVNNFMDFDSMPELTDETIMELLE